MPTCDGTKLASCLERAEWDVTTSYRNLDNPLAGPEYQSSCDDHLAETIRWVLSWHLDSTVSVTPQRTEGRR